jgi:hypothetical protein
LLQRRNVAGAFAQRYLASSESREQNIELFQLALNHTRRTPN